MAVRMLAARREAAPAKPREGTPAARTIRWVLAGGVLVAIALSGCSGRADTGPQGTPSVGTTSVEPTPPTSVSPIPPPPRPTVDPERVGNERCDVDFDRATHLHWRQISDVTLRLHGEGYGDELPEYGDVLVRRDVLIDATRIGFAEAHNTSTWSMRLSEPGRPERTFTVGASDLRRVLESACDPPLYCVRRDLPSPKSFVTYTELFPPEQWDEWAERDAHLGRGPRSSSSPAETSTST